MLFVYIFLNLLKMLELRLDNVVYVAGFASSRAEAKQLVLHNHFTLNGKKVNIASIVLSPGDEVQLKEKSRKSSKFKAIFELFSYTVILIGNYLCRGLINHIII